MKNIVLKLYIFVCTQPIKNTLFSGVQVDFFRLENHSIKRPRLIHQPQHSGRSLSGRNSTLLSKLYTRKYGKWNSLFKRYNSAARPDTTCFEHIRLFFKMESMRYHLLIAEIHALRHSSVNFLISSPWFVIMEGILAI